MRIVSDTSKWPEVEKAASTDGTRPTLSQPHLNVEKGTLEATNSYIAAVVPVEIDAGETSGPVPTEALKEWRKALRRGKADLTAQDGWVELETNEGKRSWKRPENGKWPNLPELTPPRSGFRCSVNAKFLLELARALGDDEQVILEFAAGDDRGKSNRRPIRVTVRGSEGFGLLMPIMLQDR